ncbi:hypothetical protein BDM02DRAFT_1453518 [Thelephora ganbajun]|uniref:Uncharacterized protein n=1 Tax=Thelephora ganbajun TaxID=370292 RepID=A0ACB6ZLB2_THEGA|nr:hypothetical protein BDM02DRAFT_1453518 [Thelephora ganbajun]
MRKQRRQMGDPEPVEDSGVSPPPKPEPVEELLNELPTSRAEAISTPGPPPRPRSSTPLSYTEEEPAAQHGKETHLTSRSTGQGKRCTTSDSTTPERPQKIPRRSGNFTFTTDGETCKSMATGARSIHQSPVDDSSGSKAKVEEDGLVSKVKVEEDGSVPKIKEEVGEVKINELKELKAEEKELDEHISELEKKRANIRGKIATFRAPRNGSGTRSPRPKVKTERIDEATIDS